MGAEILCFTFVFVEAINRNSAGSQLNMAVAVAHPNGIIKMTDIYGNLLLSVETGDPDDQII